MAKKKAPTIVFDTFDKERYVTGFAKRKQERREFGYLKEAKKVAADKKDVAKKAREAADLMARNASIETKTVRAARKAITQTVRRSTETVPGTQVSVEICEGAVPEWMGGSKDLGETAHTASSYVNTRRALKLEDRIRLREQEEWRDKLAEEDRRIKEAEKDKKKKKQLGLFKNNPTNEDFGDLSAGLKGGIDPNSFFTLTSGNLALHNAAVQEPMKTGKQGLGATLIEGDKRGRAVSVAVSRAATKIMDNKDKAKKDRKVMKGKKKARASHKARKGRRQ